MYDTVLGDVWFPLFLCLCVPHARTGWLCWAICLHVADPTSPWVLIMFIKMCLELPSGYSQIQTSPLNAEQTSRDCPHQPLQIHWPWGNSRCDGVWTKMVQVVKLSSDIISIIVLLHTVCDLARLHMKAVIEFSFLLLPLSAPHCQLRSWRGTWAIMFHVYITIKCFCSSGKVLNSQLCLLDQNLDCKHILTPNTICN